MQAPARLPKLPKNCQVVYAVVAAQPPGCHAAAGDIHAAARRLQASIGFSTVYRALDRLRDLGLIHEVRVPGAASALYEPARDGHAHFLCSGCGSVEDIDYHVAPREIARLNADHSVAITGVELTFNGLCATCRAVV